MTPRPGMIYNLTLEFVSVSHYTGLGVFNVIGTGERVEIRIA